MAREWRCSRRGQRGSAIVEAAIALPLILLVGLSALQWARLHQARSMVEHATFMATRAGSMANASVARMEQAFARALLPLYSPESSPQGLAETLLEEVWPDVTAASRVRILNPTREAFADFGETVNGRRELPFRDLDQRSTQVGRASGLNIQDANLLRVQMTYGYALDVPLAGWAIARAVRLAQAVAPTYDAAERAMLAAGRLPITAVATVRMHSRAHLNPAMVAAAELPRVRRVQASAGAGDGADIGAGDPPRQGGNAGEPEGTPDETGGGRGDPGGGGGPAERGPPGGNDTAELPEVSPPPMVENPPDQSFVDDLFGDADDGKGVNDGNPAQCAVGDGGGAGSGLPGLAVGNPIHVVTGNKYQRERDLGAAQSGPPGLTWERHYNSSAAGEYGSLGRGWRHPYQAELAFAADGERARLREADGRVLRFTRTAAGWRAQRAGDGRLERDADGGARWHRSDGSTYRFDPVGRLIARRGGGARLRIERDAEGHLLAVVHTRGERLLVLRDRRGRIERVLLPGGEYVAYRYDGEGNLAEAHHPDGSLRRYHYEDARHPHALTGISRGHSAPGEWGGEPPVRRYATYRYDARGRAVYSSHAEGVGAVALEYGDDRTLVTDSRGEVSTYLTARRDGVAYVKAIRGPGCSACGAGDVAYRYGERFRVTRIQQANGTTILYRYDDRGRLASAAYRAPEQTPGEPPSPAVRFAYRGATDKLTEMALPSVNPEGERLIRVGYDDHDRPRVITESGYSPRPDGGFTPIERRQRFRFDERDRLIAIDGYRTDVDDVTRIRWDDDDRLARFTLPDGSTHRILARDRYGRPTRTQIDDRPPLTLRYDGHGRVVEASNASGALALEYGADGRLERILPPHGEPVELDHDAAGRLIALTAAEGSQRLAWRRDNRLVGREWRDAEGRLLGVAERAEPRRDSARARPVGMPGAHGFSMGPAGVAVAYDALGRLAAIADARDNTTRYGVDDFGRRVFTASPDAGITRYARDDAGYLRRKTDAEGNSAAFAHDRRGLLTRVRLPDDEIRFAWSDDPRGAARLTGIRMHSGADEDRTYDAEGRLRTLTHTIGDQRYTTAYRYNDAGALVEKTLPGGRTLRYRYHNEGEGEGEGESAGALRRISLEGPLWWEIPVLRALNADKDDATRAWTAANGIRTEWDYRAGRLETLTIGELHELRYRYDREGRITGIDEGERPRERYRFDAAGRLDFALTLAALHGYRYDANGNRTERVVNARHTRYDYAAASNRLETIRSGPDGGRPWEAGVQPAAQAGEAESSAARPVGQAINTESAVAGALAERHGRDAKPLHAQYTKSGKLRRLGDLRLAYNGNGQLARLSRGKRLIAEYRYNARSQRTTKILYARDGEVRDTRHYLYERGRLAAEIDAAGAVSRHYLYRDGRSVAILADDHVYAVHTDHRGAPIAVTDEDQAIIWRAAYTPFGRARVDDDPDGDSESFTLNLRLPGQYADAESGLHYNHHRYYDPRLGRYLTSDPLGLAAGMNTYAYAANDPINHIDPSGLLLFAFDGTDNADTDPVDERTNVVQFRDAYRGDPGELAIDPALGHGGHWYYITGAGRNDARSGLNAGIGPDGVNRDLLDGNKTGERVLQMAKYLYQYIGQLEKAERSGQAVNRQLNLDIVGFSRGAAAARIFANLVDRFLAGDDDFMVTDGVLSDDVARFEATPVAQSARDYLAQSCLNVNLRFVGLWDTVPHIGAVEYNDSKESYGDEGDAYLGIPESVGHAAHALAVNERRAIFDAWSIHERPGQSGGNRIEKGFVGAHSDIGGGYAGSDLSNVAFMWMVKQAREQGGMPEKAIDQAFIEKEEYDEVFQPIANDPVYNAPSIVPNDLYYPGRYFRYLDPGRGTDVRQKDYRVPEGARDLDFASALALLEENIYQDTLPENRQRWPGGRPAKSERGSDGLFETELRRNEDGVYRYQTWLKANYDLDIKISGEDLD